MAAARGRFIAFEGGEGAGKSTQIRRLAERLRAHGEDVVETREPGGTPGAEEIRQLFVTGEAGRWVAETDALLVSAARADHVARLIRPALEAGRTVLCDRFVHSTLAYQGHGKGLPMDVLHAIHDFATGGLWPDAVLWLDLPVEEGLARSTRRLATGGVAEQRFEQLDLAYHQRVREGFAALAAADRRFHRIDASRPVEAVEEAIAAALAV
ncbi:dTMP kinase [Sandaracinobacteroides sp. A072]|uniref:dTMP kinase n=1 Tax=Sandaracinobacteroides sp. A072 TaxID=3461146 RepID=UPI004042D979